tara:strand:- start:228 stop:830 length:603 start_codon:yes stop_codon:yes gene_type:complete
MNTNQLRDLLEERDSPTSGTKRELVTRLREIIASPAEAVEFGIYDYYTFSKGWGLSIPEKSGAYAFFFSGRLLYVGETGAQGGLRKRLSEDLRDARNHALTRQIARLLYDDLHGQGEAGRGQVEYSAGHRSLTRRWMAENLHVSYVTMEIGAKDLEQSMIKSTKPPLTGYNPTRCLECGEAQLSCIQNHVESLIAASEEN